MLGSLHIFFDAYSSSPKAHSLEVKYLPRAINHLADAISRDNLHLLFSQVPESVLAQMPIPPPLLELLLDQSRLDIRELQVTCTVRELFSAGLAKSTQKSYLSCLNRYLRFREQVDISSFPAFKVVTVVLGEIGRCRS